MLNKRRNQTLANKKKPLHPQIHHSADPSHGILGRKGQSLDETAESLIPSSVEEHRLLPHLALCSHHQLITPSLLLLASLPTSNLADTSWEPSSHSGQRSRWTNCRSSHLPQPLQNKTPSLIPRRSSTVTLLHPQYPAAPFSSGYYRSPLNFSRPTLCFIPAPYPADHSSQLSRQTTIDPTLSLHFSNFQFHPQLCSRSPPTSASHSVPIPRGLRRSWRNTLPPFPFQSVHNP